MDLPTRDTCPCPFCGTETGNLKVAPGLQVGDIVTTPDGYSLIVTGISPERISWEIAGRGERDRQFNFQFGFARGWGSHPALLSFVTIWAGQLIQVRRRFAVSPTPSEPTIPSRHADDRCSMNDKRFEIKRGPLTVYRPNLADIAPGDLYRDTETDPAEWFYCQSTDDMRAVKPYVEAFGPLTLAAKPTVGGIAVS